MDPMIEQLLSFVGFGRYVGLAGLIVMICSAVDASLPQPATGSHWLPARKAISWLALNVSHAGNADQPSMASWILRVVRALADAEQADQAKRAKRAADRAAIL